jgi:2'-5' RNA ligase
MIAPHGGGRTLGVTIELPVDIRIQLDEVRQRYGTHADDWASHVTILAPIEADDAVLVGVIDHLSRVAARTRPIPMVLRGTGTFRPVSPVVFIAIADGISGCEQLEAAVRSGDLGVEARFPYHPHVTLVHGVSEELMDLAFREMAGYEAAFVAESMALHENVDGSWRIIREFRFSA